MSVVGASALRGVNLSDAGPACANRFLRYQVSPSAIPGIWIIRLNCEHARRFARVAATTFLVARFPVGMPPGAFRVPPPSPRNRSLSQGKRHRRAGVQFGGVEQGQGAVFGFDQQADFGAAEYHGLGAAGLQGGDHLLVALA